jgi:CRISPR-associated endonuclease/helicase Cas3
MEYTIKSNQAMRDDTLLEILGRNSNNVGNKNEARRTSGKLPMLAQSFMDAGRAFQAIDAPTKAVVVRHGKGVALVNELCRLAKEFEPQEYYRALKEAQQYSVNVFPNVWAKLLERDAVHETQEGEGIYYLDAEYYSEEFGLATEPVRSMDALLC